MVAHTTMASEAGPVLKLRGGGADVKRREARKRKFGQAESQNSSTQTQSSVNGESAGTTTEPPAEGQQQSKKRKTKHQKTPNPPTQDENVASHVPGSSGPEESPPKTSATDSTESKPIDPSKTTPPSELPPGDSTADPSARRSRFILFIGNLPYSATPEAVSSHFGAVRPQSIRLRTDKTTGQSKGFAFVEFDGYDRMKTCMQKYHHSTFDDGLGPARKINVELTAGGGGSKSKERREKVRTKNEKLNEQRKRRVLAEEKAKIKAAENGGRGKEKEPVADTGGNDAGDVHPSRRGRVRQAGSRAKAGVPL